jgi:hypothetical protein
MKATEVETLRDIEGDTLDIRASVCIPRNLVLELDSDVSCLEFTPDNLRDLIDIFLDHLDEIQA